MENTKEAAKKILEIITEEDAKLPKPVNLRGAIHRSLLIFARSTRRARRLEVILDDEYQRARKGYLDEYLFLRTIPPNADPKAYSELTLFRRGTITALINMVEIRETDD